MIPSPASATRLADEIDVLDVALHALAAGVALPEALAGAARDHPRRRLRSRLLDIEAALRTGGSFADGLQRAGMSASLVAAARAGDASGRLAETLHAAEAAAESRLELQRRAGDAWAQPLLTLGVAAATVAVLAVAGALPRLVDLLEQPSRTLALLRDIADLPQPVPLALALALMAGLVLAARTLVKSPPVQRVLELVPIAGGLRREQQQALALRETAVLVRAGVPVQDALALAAAGLPEASSSRRALDGLVARLRGGDTLSPEPGWPLLHALLMSPPPADRLAALIERVAAWHEAESERLGDAAAEAAGIIALMTTALTCGTLIILAWSGYFSLASQAGG